MIFFYLSPHLNNRIFLSRNYWWELDVQITAREANEGKYASFENINFLRGNCETDSSETLYCLYCSSLIFLPRVSFKNPIELF